MSQEDRKFHVASKSSRIFDSGGYASEADARIAAQELAGMCPGERFTVLMHLGSVSSNATPSKLVWED